MADTPPIPPAPPPPLAPLLEQIAEALLAAVKTVAEPEYPITLVDPRRPRGRWRAGLPDLQALVEQDGKPQRGGSQEDDVTAHVWSVPFSVTVLFNVPDEPETVTETSDDPMDAKLNLAWACITRAVMAQPRLGLDTFVLDTMLADPDYVVSLDGALEGVACNFVIRYEHKWGDPTSPAR